MAAARVGHKALKASHLDSAEKENLPPKKTKKTVSTTALFKKHSRRTAERIKNKTHDVLTPRAAGVTKPLLRGRSILSQPSRKLKALHPLVQGFQEAARQYRAGVTTSHVEGLEPVYTSLVNRIDGLTVDGAPGKHYAPSAANVEAVVNETRDITRPIAESEVLVEYKKEGTTVKEGAKIGETFQTFEKVLKHSQKKLDGLWREWTAVQEEIAVLASEMLKRPHAEFAKTDEAFRSALQKLLCETKATCKGTIKDIDAARADDKAKQSKLIKDLLSVLTD